ncbi:MAG: hypothetical protein R3A44_08425 [Caldilineaceae bacterium]
MAQTDIYKQTLYGEDKIGYITAGAIYRARGSIGQQVGRYDDATGGLFRLMRHDERELGHFTPAGRVRSHGLFEGGELGWVEPDGVVIQAGLILGEEEVGRVDGPEAAAAAAALLLLFLPDDAEENRRQARRS